MKKNELKNVRKIGNEFVTEDELKETMYMAGSYCWNKIHEHMCCEEGCMFPSFLEAVWALSGTNKELSFSLVCMMLKEARENELASDLTSVCLTEELAMECFLNSFNEIFEDSLYGDVEVCEARGEAEDDEDEIDEMQDEPVLEISIKVSDPFQPETMRQLRSFCQLAGFPFPDFLKEAEGDE